MHEYDSCIELLLKLLPFQYAKSMQKKSLKFDRETCYLHLCTKGSTVTETSVTTGQDVRFNFILY